MKSDGDLALFLMLGQIATRTVDTVPDIADGKPLMISNAYDIALSLPDSVKSANRASEAYRLFFVFERYLRDFIIETLSKDNEGTWWDRLPPDVTSEIEKLERTEEVKGWMAIGSRDKSALMTYGQLLRVMDYCWKDTFEDTVRDKALIQQARLLTHLRNSICHMTEINDEEMERVRQVIRDWFRVVSP